MPTVSLVDPGARARGPRAVPEAPAHDLDVEREVLHSALVYPELIDTLKVQPEDFYSAQNGTIWQALEALRKACTEIGSDTLRTHLLEQGTLGAVGGTDYLLELTGGIALRRPQADRLVRLARLRDVSRAAHDLAIAARGGQDVAPEEEALGRAQRALAEVESRSAPLDRVWRTVGATGMLRSPPAPRQWLLSRPNDLAPGLNPIGVLQRGKVGFMIAEGGAGKTIALTQLALAVATGRRWLDYYRCTPGRVLLALAEEDHDELHRRLHTLADAMRLTDQQLELAERHITALPLSGVSARFLDAQGERTAFLADFARRLADGQGPWALLILDPLSRFAGADTEKDNAAATLFVEAAESLLAVPGNPTVVIAHHTNKLSRTEGAGLPAKAGNARGASALTDGARWACELQSRGDDGARLTVTKSNYAQVGTPLDLMRDGDRGGYLRCASAAELAHRREAAEAAAAALAVSEDRQLESRILRALEDAPGLSKTELQKRCHANRQAVARTVDALLAARRLLVVAKDSYAVAPEPGTQGELV